MQSYTAACMSQCENYLDVSSGVALNDGRKVRKVRKRKPDDKNLGFFPLIEMTLDGDVAGAGVVRH